MIEFYDFAGRHPWLTFFLASMAVSLVALPFTFVFRCLNRVIRHFNIRSQGWPPKHCDADGDFKKEDDDDE